MPRSARPVCHLGIKAERSVFYCTALRGEQRTHVLYPGSELGMAGLARRLDALVREASPVCLCGEGNTRSRLAQLLQEIGCVVWELDESSARRQARATGLTWDQKIISATQLAELCQLQFPH